MARNAPNYGGKRSPRGSGRVLPQGTKVELLADGGTPALLRPNLAAVTRGGNSTTNTQPS